MRKAGTKLAAFLFVAFWLLVSGDAGKIKNTGEVPAERAAAAPSEGKAVVVFMRPSGLGFAVQSSVFQATDGNNSVVGIIAAQARVACPVNPGKHLFMAIAGSADVMDAELLPSKTYYTLVTPRMGVCKARFSRRSVHQQELNTAAFEKWVESCKWVETTAASEVWAG